MEKSSLGTRRGAREGRVGGEAVRDAGPEALPGLRARRAAPPVFRLRIKHGSSVHEIYIISQATVGELKKMVSGPAGLHYEDQKILFRDKKSCSSAFLDACGVKDRSKLVVAEDEVACAKRCLEARRAACEEKAAGSISQIPRQVDKLAAKVQALLLPVGELQTEYGKPPGKPPGLCNSHL